MHLVARCTLPLAGLPTPDSLLLPWHLPPPSPATAEVLSLTERRGFN